MVHLGDKCNQNFHLGRYIVGYKVTNLVLRRHQSGAVKRDLGPYDISDDKPPQMKILNGYPNSNTLLQSGLKLEHCKLHKAAHNPTKYDLFNNVKLFPTVYHRIYCGKFLTFYNQMSCYKSKCIRIELCDIDFSH